MKAQSSLNYMEMREVNKAERRTGAVQSSSSSKLLAMSVHSVVRLTSLNQWSCWRRASADSQAPLLVD